MAIKALQILRSSSLSPSPQHSLHTLILQQYSLCFIIQRLIAPSHRLYIFMNHQILEDAFIFHLWPKR
jgi:hypothetical protein